MTLKILGAVFVILGCGGFGFSIYRNHKKEVKALEQLIKALDYMENELNYQLTPLPQLCKDISAVCTGVVRRFFLALSEELDKQITPDVKSCTQVALERLDDIPSQGKCFFLDLGTCLGQFDVGGQTNAICAIKSNCKKTLQYISTSQEERLRNYQTLGLCAGAALVILFI